MKWRIILCIIVLFATFTGSGTLASIASSKTTYSGEIRKGTTLVPVREVSKFYEANISWNQSKKKLLIKRDSNLIELTIGSQVAIVNGENVSITHPPILINNKTYLPARFIAEMFGAKVSWDSNEKKATFSLQDKALSVVSLPKFEVDSEFLSLVNVGKIKGSPYSLSDKTSADEILSSYGEPYAEGYWEGGYGLKYSPFTYYVNWNIREQDFHIRDIYLTAIVVNGESKINKNPAEVKKILGSPYSEGISEMDGRYFVNYRSGNFEAYFSSRTKHSNVTEILLKEIY
ncbi:copper amine oxidase N-terminal domain-containing protein [Mangrovibacillus cuniculi]|uniref:Copper amine oxidase N-terminal domain-containing protein n=1 Tax=Mangrovibacillus cuniculi TaxID=2593652 RepID=A0A7S8CCQ1_9BACI|nr:copper amine oxidase N-terminal domain-containing protein [Mangrovibacillus cuniculi]QPC47575.1 copper amine oxidase N-terminal domain-containing protein [Mangrovibacillus cuniculi]